MTDEQMATIRTDAFDRLKDIRFENLTARIAAADTLAVWLSTGQQPAPQPETTT